MKKYNKYKDSGIKWIGEIPKHWLVGRVKDMVKIKGGKDQKKVLNENGIYPVYGSGGIFGKADKFLYNKVSVLLGRKGTIDKPLFVESPFWTVDTMYYTEILKNVSPKYFFYRCLCIDFGLYQYGSAIPSMTQGDLININFAIPPYQEQTQIANYLDTKTKTIDKKISLLQQKITNYKAYRKTLINETVTKGLDKNVKLKDSSINWIGQIPEHWEAKRIKDLAKSFIGGGTPNTGNAKYWCNKSDGGFPWVSISDITKSEYIYSTKKYVTKLGVKNSSTSLINTNTILYSIYASLGKVALTKVECATNQAILAIIENQKIINKSYFIYVLKSLEDYVFTIGNTNTQNNISLSILRKIEVVKPPMIEQQQIANFLDSKTGTIDKMINNITTQISTLQELRKTLINEVITGKVKVTD